MDDKNENKIVILNQKETNANNYKKIENKKNLEEKIDIPSDSKEKEKTPTVQNRYIDNEVESIINRDPFEELKLIQQKIKNENTKIRQINSQLEKINNNNSKSTKKRKGETKDDFDTYLNNLKNKNNNLITPNINIASSQQISKSGSLTLDPSIKEIYKKMENLRKIKIERINNNDKTDIEEQNNRTENRYIFKTKTDKDKIDSRLLAIEEEIKKDKEEKQKKYEKKVKLFREKELEREKQRKKYINQINNISVSPKNKYSPKKNYITSEEKEQIRKLKEESLFQIEKEKRKFKYLPISSEELDNFSKEVKKNEKILQSELSKKKKQMEELWKERKNLLPKYHSKFMDLNIELDNEAKEELIVKQEKLKNKELERVNFGKEVIKNYQPKILNDKLKTERLQRIKELKGVNRFDNIKELGNKLKQKSVKLVQSQPKNFSKNNVFKYEETVGEKQAKKLTGKPVDFLLLCRQKKEKMDYESLMQENSAKKMKEWKEMLDNGGKNTYNNVERIKMQAAVLNDKANNINQRLKQESNYTKKDELSQEASNLYINSIQAKLQILNKLYISED